MHRSREIDHSVMKPLSGWTYVASLALWISLFIGAGAIVISVDIRDVEKALTQYGDTYADHLNMKMVSSETILKGFSALFGAVGATDPSSASRYARQVIEHNPQIFALEIVQEVKNDQLAEFVAGKRRGGMPNFAVKSFSYDSDRKWQALQKKAFYYPIVFMEPLPSGSEDVLGLDVQSVPFLQLAMTESLQRRTPVASHPFRLVEGNLAYVVFCPIPQTFRRDAPPFSRTSRDELVVDMVIDADKLTEPAKIPISPGWTVLVYHKDFRPDDPRGQLLAMSGPARSPLETALFPSFIYSRPLATMGKPFSLMVKRQVGWSDLSLGLLALLAGLALASSLILFAFLRSQHRGRILQLENQQRLWELANHDALTGLPNRMLLTDRLEQSLARMARLGKRMAVLFLDIDAFKQINDTYGHAVGDQLLKFVAERLRTAVRVDDTVARMSGDEFILLIESLENREAIDAVCQKINEKLSDGFTIEAQVIRVRASVGFAIFPEDGTTPEALIKQADMKMYANKQAHTTRLYLV